MASRAVAYIAPEIPGLSATFVYEEILALQARGYEIVPFSVHVPGSVAKDQLTLSKTTIYLYQTSVAQILMSFCKSLVSREVRLLATLKMLISDCRDQGIFTLDSAKLVYQFIHANHAAIQMLRRGCEHIHIHFAHVPTQIGMYASSLTGIPFTFTGHANDIFERGKLLTQKAERSAKMVTISQHNRALLIDQGIQPEKIAVVRCGVSFPISTAPNRTEQKGGFRVGSIGRLVEKKGFDVLIKAFAKLRAENPDVTLEIAGDGPLRTEIEELITDLELAGSIHLLGAMDHKEVSKWLRSLDLFVLACKVDRNGDMDGIPVVLMEAMSQGIPVVSTNLSGIPELIVDHRTGLLAAPGSVEELFEKMREIGSDDELRDRLAINALDHVDVEFGQKTNIDRLEQVFAAPVGTETNV
ncbi:glycosyltransferase family 4 protein [Hwanghaeella sp.]|uniref:glycosyltransferase family 4 protein n=1 Tax=Hwanghaeella sp. TaxID=2605943 RepID=UPI003CCB892A